eukprot:gene5813-9636_t
MYNGNEENFEEGEEKNFEVLNGISIELKLKNEWNSENDISFITKEFLKVLNENPKIFQDLNTDLKLKLLMSCLSMNKNHLKNLKNEFNELIQLGLNDENEWVTVVSEILSEYPTHFCLKNDIQNEKIFGSLESFHNKCLNKIKTNLKDTQMNENDVVISNPLILKYINFSNEEKSYKNINHFKKNENFKKNLNQLQIEQQEEKLNLKEKIKEKSSSSTLTNSLEEKLANLRRNSEKMTITNDNSKQKKNRSLKQIDENEANQKIKEYTQNVKKRKTLKFDEKSNEIVEKKPKLDFQFGNPFQFQNKFPNQFQSLMNTKQPISQMLNDALNNKQMNSPSTSNLTSSPFLFSTSTNPKQLIPKIAPRPQFQQFLAQQKYNVKLPSNVNLNQKSIISPTNLTSETNDQIQNNTETHISPPSSSSAPPQQPPQILTTKSDEKNELKVKEQCENLLKGCNKVNDEIKNQIFKFLMGIDDEENEKIKNSQDKKIRLLLHEEPNQHQIIFQLDFENHSWKKLMKKIKP